MILNPNCSETVIRLRHKDIGNFTGKEMIMYLNLLDTGSWGYSDKPVEGYSNLRGNKEMKAHYYYQTIGNELIAFAYWLGLDFDTDEVWHCEDILSWEEDKKYEEIQEYLSETFTEFEYVISKL